MQSCQTWAGAVGLAGTWPVNPGLIDAPWRKAVAAWRCPALLLLGSERNAIITPQRADEACAINSAVRWVQIAGAGHSIRFDQFDAYVAAVRAFL